MKNYIIHGKHLFSLESLYKESNIVPGTKRCFTYSSHSNEQRNLIEVIGHTLTKEQQKYMSSFTLTNNPAGIKKSHDIQ